MPVEKAVLNTYSNDMSEVLVLLSGGIDSATCLSFYIDVDRPTSGLFIDYQQAAASQELQSAKTIAKHYGITLHTAKWTGIKKKSEGFINARNAFLLTAALMECPSLISTVAIGIHSGSQYPDCSATFIDKMQSIFTVYTNTKIILSAPFVNWNKRDIWEYAQSNNVPLQYTYSCETGSDEPCGKCLSCLDSEALVSHA